MLQVRENVDISGMTTFRLPATIRYFTIVKTIEDIREAYDFAEGKGLSVVVLGGGSNVVFKVNNILPFLVIKIEIAGFSIVSEDASSTTIRIGAGESWDNAVAQSVALGLSGIEAMSAIPGCAGATPIQNVGAYGQEIKDTLVELEAYEIATRTMRTFTNEECRFAYRDSIFKREAKGKYIITSITLKLAKSKAKIPDYPGVKKYFDERGIADPTLVQIREAIIAIRNVKLPDPREIASVGSFFKNPFVPAEQYEKLKIKYPNIVAFPTGEQMKIGAGWLIDTLGWKGKDFGTLLLYPHNALVVVNKGAATYAELEDVVAQIKKAVLDMFGIVLEQEPEVISEK